MQQNTNNKCMKISTTENEYKNLEYSQSQRENQEYSKNKIKIDRILIWNTLKKKN